MCRVPSSCRITSTTSPRFADATDAAAAERLFREATRIAPKVARLRYNFGTFLVQRSRYREAIAS